MKIQLAVCVFSCATVMSYAAQGARTSLDGVFSSSQVERGESVYLDNCVSCHGPELRGAEGGPALLGSDFNSEWDGHRLGELFEKVKSTMPMNAPGSLSESQYVDILAFVLSKGGSKPGQIDLSIQSEVLNGISYRAPKP